MLSPSIPNVLTIAGSDSGGGAGIQADLKAISARGAFGLSVITALTAQNTCGVTGVEVVSSAFVKAQLDAVFDDIDVAAIKTGMLANAEIVATVVDVLRAFPAIPLVVDPVMVATSGDLLLHEQAVDAVRSSLIPLATVITPNIPEAATLLGWSVEKVTNDPEAAAQALCKQGARAVLLKGGHGEGDTSTDLLYMRGQSLALQAPRIGTTNTHGTGCTLASALAAELAHGRDLSSAVTEAKEYITAAINAADQLHVGRGHGPVNHFYQLWQSKQQ